MLKYEICDDRADYKTVYQADLTLFDKVLKRLAKKMNYEVRFTSTGWWSLFRIEGNSFVTLMTFEMMSSHTIKVCYKEKKLIYYTLQSQYRKVILDVLKALSV